MRRIILVLLAVLLFLGFIGGGASYSMALNTPYLPGDILYDLQLRSERLWALTFNNDLVYRAEILLELFSRRLNEFEAVLGTAAQDKAVAVVDVAFTEALTAVADAPDAAQPQLLVALARLSDRGQALLENLETDDDELARQVAALDGRFGRFIATAGSDNPNLAALLDDFSARAEFAAELVLTPETDAVAAVDNLLNDPRVVPFPPNADISALHTFFPLMGGHANQDCTNCHTGTTYSGVDSRCAACHLDDDVHEGINGADCAACHTINNWQDAEFDHATIGARDCVECHDPPQNHFEGACRDCHQDTNNFRNAVFNHNTIGGQDCVNCHAAPANHFEGACRDCHQDTNNFRNAVFNHNTIGGQDCVNCHAAPANHFQGACRDCHQDTNNFRNAVFNHNTIGGQDCVNCHAAPANHFQGACRDCHQDTNNFRNAVFNHSTIGGQDCVNCHAAPANHFQGTCTNCHGDTTNFGNAAFNHAGFTDCQSCHAPPANHFPGQCSQCHSTATFSGASFNHSFPVNHGDANGTCAACHTDNGSGPSSCFLCHNQQNIENEHREEGISDFGNCLSCHPDGEEGDSDDHEDEDHEDEDRGDEDNDDEDHDDDHDDEDDDDEDDDDED